MGTITTNDGVEIFYKDWGSGQPIVFSHGWPLSSDDWDTQMLFFLQHGYRVIAHDRRGHGRSTQTGDGHDMDHYADDLAALTAHLALHDAVHVGHSTGGGESCTTSPDTARAASAKAVLISSVPRSWCRPTPTPAACRRACSTTSRPSWPRPVRFYRALASGPFYWLPTGPVRSPRMRSSRTGGVRG
jgi:non-heme chloroperoxidase